MCRQLGFEVALPAFEGDASQVRKTNQQLLASCDAVILFYGAGDEAWKRAIDNELKKMAGYRGGKPLPAMYTYLAEPRTSDKEDLIDMEEPGLIDGLGGFAEAAIAKSMQAADRRRSDLMSAATASSQINPFPGLRPFREDEEHLFFGRENQVDAMVNKLADTRFLAVVGTSGSGKSSLVNCGLRPALRQGLMARGRHRVAHGAVPSRQ